MSETFSVAYFAPDATQGSVAKRIACFIDEGIEVTSFTFRRDRKTTFQPLCRNIDLGAVPNEQYLRRALHMGGVVRRLWGARDELRRADVYYARMLDSALIALLAKRLFNPRAKVYYEVCDIRRIMMNEGPAGRAARALERIVLGSIERMVVNSPEFVPAFFQKRQGFKGSAFLLENKIYSRDLSAYASMRQEARASAETRSDPVVIAWFGNLDDPVTWAAIKSVASRFPDKVRFYLRGYPIIDRSEFDSVVSTYPNIEFGGPFNNLVDLPAMYEKVDVVLGLDLMNQEGNSWWLLPNSLYEAGAFGKPLITSEGTLTASRVAGSNTGWVLAEPVEDTLTRFVETFSWEEYRSMIDRIVSVDPSVYAGQDQFRALVDLMRGDIASRDLPTGQLAGAAT